MQVQTTAVAIAAAFLFGLDRLVAQPVFLSSHCCSFGRGQDGLQAFTCRFTHQNAIARRYIALGRVSRQCRIMIWYHSAFSPSLHRLSGPCIINARYPRSRVQSCAKETHTSIQVQRRHSGIPCAMALPLIARSPRRRIRLVTVAAGLMAKSDPVGSTSPPAT